ncbi:MAG: histidine phosphatase family protein [Lachnospiraceae bacterium]|uniref:Histidine phosphatase family protein n=1 Tax=Candidatus Weimeria bifida TaxID=2599074 RepID=A0A6N7IXX6_9FIRM|nr:histidine phosphatase family protein [Candidatus Weimeria bifida]RRF95461.1 MAG: histidine phosphatase family protein [Lachnospiraceae bacterium]
MACIYFVRHGQTYWNVEGKVCGRTDIDLTPTGYRQAERTGHLIREKMDSGEVKADELLASPLSRARHTAETIAKITGLPMSIEPRLIEQNFGRYEGTARDGAEFQRSKQNFADSYSGGESMLKLGQRIFNLLDDLKEREEATGKTYILVAHNGIARMVQAYFHDMTNEEFSNSGIDNCELVRFDFK